MRYTQQFSNVDEDYEEYSRSPDVYAEPRAKTVSMYRSGACVLYEEERDTFSTRETGKIKDVIRCSHIFEQWDCETMKTIATLTNQKLVP